MTKIVNKKIERSIAGIMALVMLVIMLFSTSFVVFHANHYHDCHHDDCPVCACVHQCENVIRGFGSSLLEISVAILPTLIFLFTISLCECSLVRETPVSRKVRLND